MVKSRWIRFVLIMVFVGAVLPACKGLSAQQESRKNSLIDDVVEFALTQEGKPYRSAGVGPRGFDCSGLMYYSFGKYGIELPRDSRSQSREGVSVAKKDLKKGDLVFFKGRNLLESRVGHVGLVTEVTQEGVFFIHATSRGVVIDGLEELSYYRKRYLTARRLRVPMASANPKR